MIKKIKNIILKCIFILYLIKCKIKTMLYGPNGIGMVLENCPEIFIIPIMKKYGLQIGENSRIMPGIIFNHLAGKKPFEKLVIGSNVYVGRKILFDMTDKIEIEDESMFGAGSMFWTHYGDFSYDSSDYHEKVAPIRIGKGVLCWSRVIVSPGVKIGDYSRVAAGSIVVSNLDSKSFYGGVPAKFIKNRNLKSKT
jgi:putative colanic acid biosynthesis acetyltransferase WcaF